MKRGWYRSVAFCEFNWLYIPHGSDETRSKIALSSLSICFISHMVQMKPVAVFRLLLMLLALYPTWFRWNWVWCVCCKYEFYLYIPHGSDETIHTLRGLGTSRNFISHMVQMKLIQVSAYADNEVALYPTWFRWNPNSCWGRGILGTALYPTWFRWNSVHQIRPAEWFYLYIPHGSDETVRNRPFHFFSTYFISHMVQMKLSAQSTSLYTQFPTLYPTWFRWNELSPTRLVCPQDTLYPTWFRWN